MDVPPLISIVCLISAGTTLSLGVFVYARSPGKTENRLFLLLSFLASFWAFYEFMIKQAREVGTAEFWSFVGSAWILCIPVTMQFVLTLTQNPYSRRDKAHILVATIYLPAIIFLILDLGAQDWYSFPFIPGFGYDAIPGENAPFYYIEILFAFIVIAWAEWVILQVYRQAKTRQIRQQYLFIMGGIAIPTITSLFAILLFPTVSSGASVASAIGLLGFVIAISYAMLRYGLFVLTPVTAAHNIIQTMPDGMILTNSDGWILSGNPAAVRLLGINADEIDKHSIHEFFSEVKQDGFLEMITGHGQVSDYETSVWSQQGEIPVSIAGSLIHNPEGETAGTVLIIRDISDRKTTEDELRQAQEKIDLLNRITRHDVLNLQTAMFGYLHLAEELAGDPDLRRCITSCHHLTRRITDHIRFARDYQDIGDHTPSWHILAHAVEMLTQEYADQNITTTPSSVPAMVRADPLFSKVLSNLIDNAVRHGESVTQITISWKQTQDGNLIIRVKDNGRGIPAELKDRIFEQGYGKNTGLGLTLCREILLITGITIQETGTPGEGACFELNVPADEWKQADREVITPITDESTSDCLC